MTYLGTVHHGVIVLPEGVSLPEGASVRVEPVELNGRKASADSDDDLDPIYRMGDLAVDLGVPDLATNLDYYLYGHPKVTDGQ